MDKKGDWKKIIIKNGDIKTIPEETNNGIHNSENF